MFHTNNHSILLSISPSSQYRHSFLFITPFSYLCTPHLFTIQTPKKKFMNFFYTFFSNKYRPQSLFKVFFQRLLARGFFSLKTANDCLQVLFQLNLFLNVFILVFSIEFFQKFFYLFFPFNFLSTSRSSTRRKVFILF